MRPRLPSSSCACSPPRSSASRLPSSSSHRAYSMSNAAAPARVRNGGNGVITGQSSSKVDGAHFPRRRKQGRPAGQSPRQPRGPAAAAAMAAAAGGGTTKMAGGWGWSYLPELMSPAALHPPTNRPWTTVTHHDTSSSEWYELASDARSETHQTGWRSLGLQQTCDRALWSSCSTCWSLILLVSSCCT